MTIVHHTKLANLHPYVMHLQAGELCGAASTGFAVAQSCPGEQTQQTATAARRLPQHRRYAGADAEAVSVCRNARWSATSTVDQSGFYWLIHLDQCTTSYTLLSLSKAQRFGVQRCFG